MSTNTPLSRIARHLTLRRADIVGHIGSFIAASLTVLVVGTAWGMEGNPVARWIISAIGVGWWAVLTPLGVATGFALCRTVSRYGSERFALGIGWLFAAALLTDGLLNALHFAQDPIPGYMLAHGWVYYGRMAAIGLVAVICVTRPSPLLAKKAAACAFHRVRTFSSRAAPVAVAVLMITSVFAGVVVLSTQPMTGEESGIAKASDGGTVYAGNSGGDLEAIDQETGDVIWTFSDFSSAVQGISVAPDGETVYAVGGSNVRAINASTGSEKWASVSLPDSGLDLSTSPDGETVYVGDASGAVTAIKASDGSEKWSFTGHSDAAESVSAGPKGEKVYSGSSDGTLKALDASDGSELWTYSGFNDNYVEGVSAGPDGETVYAGGQGNILRAINTSDGTEKWNFDHGKNINDIVAGADGEKVFTALSNGNVEAVNTDTENEEWSYSSGSSGALSISSDSNGDEVYVGLDNGNASIVNSSTGNEESSYSVGGFVYAVSGGPRFKSGSTGQTVNGTVTNQAGDAISNATVQLTISKKPSVPEADSQLDSLSNPIPSEYSQQLDGGFSLYGDDGYLANNEGEYAAIYSTSDLGLTYKQSADLREPKVSDIEPGEEQAIILADTEADCGIAGFETNEYNRQIPGCVQPEGNVTIEKLSSTGEVVSTDEVSVEEAGNQRDFGGPTDIHYATYTFTTGVYRISPPDGTSYLIKVGTPRPDYNQYEQTIENQRTQQAQAMQDALNEDTLVVKQVATNETGHWNASVPSNAKVIAVSARKAPGVDVAPENLTYDNMSAAYNSENPPNASVYLPSTTRRVEPGASNVEITLQEVAFPSFARIDRLQNRIQTLQNRLNNLTMDDLPPALLQRLETESTEDLERTWTSMRGTLENFEPAREAYLEISDRDSLPTADELSKSELQAAIRNANLAITQTASTIDISDGNTETTEDTISQTWELSGINVDETNVSVIADYSNGTSRVVSDEYIAVDSNIGRPDQVTVENFPLGEEDPAMVSFRLRVAGNSELGTDSKTITNPQFTGEAPTIDAVELTSLQPGPSDRVTVEVHPDASSTFGEVTSMTVYGPAGNELETSNISEGTKASFTTNGEGVHSIRFTVETDTGRQFVDVVQVEASSEDEPMRPSIYARSGPLGTYAVVGDGFESGDVEVADDGSIDVVGILNADADVPNKIDVFTEGLDRGSEATTTVRVVRGESRESVRKNILVVVHGPQLNSPTDSQEGKAIAYANGNPVTWDGSTRFGVIEQDGDGSSIHAYTEADGVLRLEVDNTPGFIERQRFWLSQNAPWVPGIGFLTGGGTLLGGFVLVRRRQRGAGN